MTGFCGIIFLAQQGIHISPRTTLVSRKSPPWNRTEYVMNAAEVLGTTNWRIVLMAGARKRNEKVLKRMARKIFTDSIIT